jgi:glutamate-1-semialdehyde 2,1-aminomutase/spore coat polysaccharide biosynthesis protein SpsF
MNTRGRTVAIVQARMASERLPGKAMADIAGRPAIGWVLERVHRALRVDEVWLACSEAKDDDPLAAHGERLGVRVFRGSEDDVMSRFAAVAERSNAEAIVRVTGDCPFIDPGVIDAVVERFHDCAADFVSNTLTRSYPDGLDTEVFSRDALMRADREAKHPFLRLHVTPYIHGRLRDVMPCGDFSREQVVNEADFSHLRWTLDEAEDLDFFRAVAPELQVNFTWLDVVAACTRKPRLLRINHRDRTYSGTKRDLEKLAPEAPPPRRFDKSNHLFDRAATVIPLASQTFSKSHLQWVRGASPLFFTHGRGCRVWDADGNGYIDHVLGLLPVILGYRDPDVDAAIEAQLESGITFSLAHPLEIELAERLVELIPCAEMARFGKNGSDATTAAVRLARAHTGRDRVALCGYHGWHDWYIGTTSRDAGVPGAVRKLSHAFPYNDADALEALFKAAPDAYAAVIMEPAGAQSPEPGFLERVREVTSRHGVVLIFDEIIAGFRLAMGGAQAHYGVTPDLACFGKAMANGMPISAVVGGRDIMRGMEEIFFSTTFGGETLSLAAALATLDKLRREDAIPRLRRRGAKLMAGANGVFAAHGLGETLSFGGADWWPRLTIDGPAEQAQLVTSLLRQELVANGLFLGASFNLCLAHDDDAVTTETLAALDAAAGALRDALDSADPATRLRGAPVRPVFAVR